MLSRTLTILSFVGASMVTAALADAFPFNPTLFKDLNVTRGLNYHYYASPAEAGKPTLLFLHGFPSTSFDWRHQVSFFQEKGYGLLVPDMLGCGSTAKPSDPQLYASSLVTKDIIDILDAENVDRAVVIGHDWLVFIQAYSRASYLLTHRYAGVQKLPAVLLTTILNVSAPLLFCQWGIYLLTPLDCLALRIIIW